MAANWTPDSWTRAEARQMPDYPDAAGARRARPSTLASYPPLVFAGEARDLTADLAQVAAGKAFLLQGGDCAESFAEFHPNNIRDTFRVILQMAVVLTYRVEAAGREGRPHGGPVRQAALAPTPRRSTASSCPAIAATSSTTSPSRRTAARPIPQRMIQAYSQSAATLNLLRAFAQGGYANLHQVHRWTHRFHGPQSLGAEVSPRPPTGSARRSSSWRRAGSTPRRCRSCSGTNFYTSHEALLLPYEQALTRQDSLTGDWYDTSAHFLWIGDRTRFEGSRACRISARHRQPDRHEVRAEPGARRAAAAARHAQPGARAGRMTLITRYGHDKIEAGLPKLVRAVQREGHPVVWSCDPMHGNVVKAANGYKTRPVRPHPRRGARLLRGAPRRGHASRAASTPR